MHLHAQCCTTRRTAPHDTTSRRHLSFAENESAMPLHKSDEQSPRSGYRAGAVLSRPQRTALPGGLADAILEALPYTVAVVGPLRTTCVPDARRGRASPR